MPNHFHILVKEISDHGISLFMEKLSTGYSKYFNTKYRRVGPLFQGRFKARRIDNDEYLKYLTAYIHLNPVKLIDPMWKKNGIRNRSEAELFLKNYRYSSYGDYLGIPRLEKLSLTAKEFPEYYETIGNFASEVADWLEYRALEQEGRNTASDIT